MADSYGNWNPTDTNALAPGTSHDAGIRGYRKVFDLANDDDAAGGTSNRLHIGRIREGTVPKDIKVYCSANASAINLSAGDGTTATAFCPATAGPNATEISLPLNAATRAMDPTTGAVDIYLTPSGNLPATGTIVTWVEASHR